MNMTHAIDGLFRCWMRDITARTQLPEGRWQALLYLLETLAHQLAAAPTERWFDALPAKGEAQAFYRDIVLPLQRELEWDDGHTVARLEAHIGEMRRRWIRMPASSIAAWEQALFEMALDERRGAGPGYISPSLSDDPVLYFAFVEDVETIPAGQRVYAASGLPIETPSSGAELEHVRFSAIAVDRFLPLTVQIDPVNPDTAGQEQRARRKEQLREALDGIALPVFDLFIHPDARGALGIESAFGDWCLLGHGPSPDDDEGFSIYTTNPDDGEHPTTTRVGLGLLVQAPEFWQNRLRDIFSLVHIPDADFGETERGDGNPVPNPPIAPHIEEADELGDEAAEQVAEPPAIYRSAG